MEFVGLPGAGKSYLCKALGQSLTSDRFVVDGVGRPSKDQGVRWLGFVVKIGEAAVFVLRHPRCSVRAAKVILKSRQCSGLDLLRKSVNLFAELRYLDACGESAISEQGVLQAVWSIDFRAKRRSHPELLRAIKDWLPNSIVEVEADKAVICERLADRERGRSRLDGKQGESLMEELDEGSLLLGEILQSWRQLMPTGRRLTVSNAEDADVNQVLGTVRRWIAETIELDA